MSRIVAQRYAKPIAAVHLGSRPSPEVSLGSVPGWSGSRKGAQRKGQGAVAAIALPLLCHAGSRQGRKCGRGGVRGRSAALAAVATGRPLPSTALPEPLCAEDGLAPGAPPEDVFTWDTVSKRMPAILDSVLESLPEKLAGETAFIEGVRQLQREMREGAPLKPLQSSAARVGAEAWNKDLAGALERAEGWHKAPWWLVENYMYKRLLQELAGVSIAEAVSYDPFSPQKSKAIESSAAAYELSLRPLLELVAEAEATPLASQERRRALEAALVRSLWGNQADLSLSAGKVASAQGGVPGQLISDDSSVALDLLEGVKGGDVVLVLDNHGLEVICDLVLADAILRLAEPASVTLHVKDAPVFVSDVTEEDIPSILDWLEERDPSTAARLSSCLAQGSLRVLAEPFYTTARTFWQLPQRLSQDFSNAALVLLKGDANYRRLLGDLHWPYDTNFAAYVQSFWPSRGLVALRTMKSGVALGIPETQQQKAKETHPEDWLTCGYYGQILAAAGAPAP